MENVSSLTWLICMYMSDKKIGPEEDVLESSLQQYARERLTLDQWIHRLKDKHNLIIECAVYSLVAFTPCNYNLSKPGRHFSKSWTTTTKYHLHVNWYHRKWLPSRFSTRWVRIQTNIRGLVQYLPFLQSMAIISPGEFIVAHSQYALTFCLGLLYVVSCFSMIGRGWIHSSWGRRSSVQFCLVMEYGSNFTVMAMKSLEHRPWWWVLWACHFMVWKIVGALPSYIWNAFLMTISLMPSGMHILTLSKAMEVSGQLRWLIYQLIIILRYSTTGHHWQRHWNRRNGRNAGSFEVGPIILLSSALLTDNPHLDLLGPPISINLSTLPLSACQAQITLRLRDFGIGFRRFVVTTYMNMWHMGRWKAYLTPTMKSTCECWQMVTW